MFDMIEFYESCLKLNISNNSNIGVRGWQATTNTAAAATAVVEKRLLPDDPNDFDDDEFNLSSCCDAGQSPPSLPQRQAAT